MSSRFFSWSHSCVAISDVTASGYGTAAQASNVFRSAPLRSLSRVDDLPAISLRSRATVIGSAAPNFFCCTRATLASVYTSKSARASAALLSSPPFLRGRLRIICSSCCFRGSGRDGRPEIEGGISTLPFDWRQPRNLRPRVEALLSMGHRHHRLRKRWRGASIATVRRCDGWPAGPAPCTFYSTRYRCLPSLYMTARRLLLRWHFLSFPPMTRLAFLPRTKTGASHEEKIAVAAIVLTSTLSLHGSCFAMEQRFKIGKRE